ncbi:hypothetical protein EF917_19570 [Streptomyces sp. WAC00469]|nr:hypothetical protein EF917_19570 [Streptomyces sp. WAC00469]
METGSLQAGRTREDQPVWQALPPGLLRMRRLLLVLWAALANRTSAPTETRTPRRTRTPPAPRAPSAAASSCPAPPPPAPHRATAAP